MKKSKANNKLMHGARTAGLLILIAVVAAGCGAAPGAEQSAAAQLQNKPIKVAKISSQSMGSPKEQVADVLAVNQVDVMPKADGQVVEVLKRKGDLVQKGDVILRIDTKDIALQMEKSQSSLNSAQQALAKSAEDLSNSKTEMRNSVAKSQSQLDTTEKDYNKMHNDYDAGLATKKQLDQAETQLNNARRDLELVQDKLNSLESTNALSSQQSQVDSARIAVQDAGNTLDNYAVKSTIDGVLSDMTAEVGMTISRSSKVGQVQQTDKLKIKAELTESAAKLARNKPELVFYSANNPSQKQKAKVTYLADMMNAQTKMYPIELEVTNTDPSIKPGSRVQLQLTSEQEEMALAVPSLSIVREGSDTFVYILKSDTVEKRKVKLGRVKEANQEILEGVKADEQVVISGQHQLKDGQKVEVAK
ncbi:efflux RND transporter periplasmic adaptor subunit [Paenibacillus radicis (ex Xue et al. 2023)]|uniref:Efflux RND transporter periplasmic adaptor subunit n=1 Tax=Paenibacillus radicis (ex Xue et al. 2023) TaxID=2972489 RepID=A0ABT1YPG9_9BACL|nr:efflux RND transporter periplasmic adaptor subunit [Paenibacillus radicis (ex Xue et al. 2023)]MCR8635080.1 efflux RND transporter periplasmic adaptor subunit [Paenibacillus radicis (ex Xue et al. 2023)]